MKLGDTNENWKGLWGLVELRWNSWSEINKVIMTKLRYKLKLQYR